MEDFTRLLHEYEVFLQTNDLFEPLDEIPQVDTHEKKYTIFFPEVIEDYSQYQDILDHSEDISKASISAIDSGKELRLELFENSNHECRWLFIKINSLLQSGIAVEDIVITACNLEEIKAQLVFLSSLYGIPIQIHKGEVISAFLVSRIFTSIKDCFEDEFSLRSIKSLIFNNTLPWKDRMTAYSLVRFGITNRCVKNRGKGGTDLWEQAFKRVSGNVPVSGAGISRIAGFYKAIHKSIQKINRSGSFEELRDNFTSFFNIFLSAEVWDPEQEKIFQFALSSLDELCTSLQNLKGLDPGDPFSVFLGYLETKIYVQRSQGRAISVYPYRVSAGIMPKYHFIINASQLGMKHSTGDFSWLSEYEKAASPQLIRDLTEDFFSLYACSGEEVIMTHSKEGFSRRNIIPSYFITKGQINIHPDTSEIERNDPYIREELVWMGKIESTPDKIFAIQKTGFSNSLESAFVPRGVDYSRVNIQKDDQEKLVLHKIEKNGMIALSSTSLELFVSCPFQYLLERVLRLKEEDPEILLADPRDFGTIMHSIFQAFYQAIIREHAGRLPPDMSITQKLMKDTVTHTLDDYSRSFPIPVTPAWNDWKESFFELSEVFVRNETTEYGNWRVVSTEENMQLQPEGKDILLNGKIDRISETGGKLAIIDYKKKSGVSQKAIFSENPKSFQIPFYVYLSESLVKMPVEKAGYYLIEDGSYCYVFDCGKKGKESLEREKIDAAIRRLLDIIENTARRIRTGDFTIDNELDNGNCGSCIYRGVCRRKFLINAI